MSGLPTDDDEVVEPIATSRDPNVGSDTITSASIDNDAAVLGPVSTEVLPPEKPSLFVRIAKGYQKFFFHEEVPVGAFIFHKLLCLWTICYLSPRFYHAWELYARPFLRQPHKHWYKLGKNAQRLEAWSREYISPDIKWDWAKRDLIFTTTTFRVIIGICILMCVYMLFSKRKKTLVHGVFYLLFGFIFLADGLMPRAYGGFSMYQWAWLWLIPYGSVFAKTEGLQRVPRFGARILQIQFCSIYFFTVLAKAVDGGHWVTGKAVGRVFLNPRYGNYWLSSFEWPEWMTMLMTWGTLVGEWTVALLIWFPKTRKYAMAMVVLLHVNMMVAMRVSNLFHFLMIIHIVLFVPEETYRRWFPWLFRRAEKSSSQNVTATSPTSEDANE